ncbi:MAG TPA: hypothetical protein VFU72_10860 [Nitrolancea sp.]|nr:hypothetical protein [Nitrolancea sp.]
MSPTLILALTLGSIAGLLAHALLGRRLWQLPCFWLAGVGGFLAGEIVAILAGVEFFRLGSIPLPAALAGSLLGAVICWFFTAPHEPRPRRRVRRVARAADARQAATDPRGAR